MRISKEERATLAAHIVARITEDMSVNYSRDTEDHDGGLDVADDTLRRLILAAVNEVAKP
jgi:hypothetical protein